MAIGTASVELPTSHRKLPLITALGARVVIERDGEHLFSGPMRGITSTGPRSTGTVVVTFEDDFRLLSRILGFPVPTFFAAVQGAKSDVRVGPAETVAKGFLADNLVRFNGVGLPVTVEPPHGWGSTVRVESRMAPLADKLLTVVDGAGVGLSVRQTGAGLRCEAYQPRVYPRTLSEDGGTVTGWSYSYQAPTATRTVIGGPDQETARTFQQIIDTAREAEHGDVIEVFTDAGGADSAAALTAAGQATLDEGAAKSGFSVELSETKVFRYGGDGVRVGDRVTVDIGGQLLTDVLREANLVWNRDTGLTITPTIGADTSVDKKMASIILKLARGIRDLRTR